MPRSAIVGTHRRQSAGNNSRDVLNDALRSEGHDSKAVSLNLRGGDDEGTAGLMQTLKVGFYFGLWYALNIVYNSKSFFLAVFRMCISRQLIAAMPL